ncbi:flagellar protein FliT [Methylotenera versatilis]|jgi:flagellar protein FliT|uniref:Flagellar protein FliT n=1 Tax=Methylotenera versatilis (strain 301) TaxID=666681 RepID=D7DQ11_METV0|nr:flagellar protein FliT [Methylotenera versatilis]ADI29382.1 putative flagellar synthesis (flagellar regulon) [Methylotenera versatilis 301]
MEHQDTIVIYETVAELTKKMLLAAKQQDWDALAELEASCAQQVATLKLTENALPLPSDVRARKLASIKSILADDREIRNIVSPWMVRLNSLMNSLHMENKLTRAYNQ